MFNISSTPQLHHPIQTFMVDKLSVRVYKSETELAQDAALIARDYLHSVLTQKGAATVILATGNSQIKFLQVLTALDGVDWSQITLFHLDEYLGIDADHPSSFRCYLRERVEKLVKPKQFHYIEGDALQPLDECERYSKLLQAQPIDLCCLGIGENGHLAFNEPSVANFDDPHLVKLVKLDSKNCQQQVKDGHFSSVETVPQYAFTLTIPLILSARKIICLAPQKRKATAIKKMLQEKISTTYPASVLREKLQSTLFLDLDSASLLS